MFIILNIIVHVISVLLIGYGFFPTVHKPNELTLNQISMMAGAAILSSWYVIIGAIECIKGLL